MGCGKIPCAARVGVRGGADLRKTQIIQTEALKTPTRWQGTGRETRSEVIPHNEQLFRTYAAASIGWRAAEKRTKANILGLSKQPPFTAPATFFHQKQNPESIKIQGFNNGSGGWDRTNALRIDYQRVSEPVSAIVSGAPPGWNELPEADRTLLGRVIQSWATLNGSLKLAVLAIVDSH